MATLCLRTTSKCICIMEAAVTLVELFVACKFRPFSELNILTISKVAKLKIQCHVVSGFPRRIQQAQECPNRSSYEEMTTKIRNCTCKL